MVAVSQGNYRPPDPLRNCQLTSSDRTKGDTYYVHFFTPYRAEDFQLHGKAIPPERFSKYYDPPDPRLIAWHYNQAVKACIRGYSVGMRPEITGRPQAMAPTLESAL